MSDCLGSGLEDLDEGGDRLASEEVGEERDLLFVEIGAARHTFEGLERELGALIGFLGPLARVARVRIDVTAGARPCEAGK